MQKMCNTNSTLPHWQIVICMQSCTSLPHFPMSSAWSEYDCQTSSLPHMNVSRYSTWLGMVVWFPSILVRILWIPIGQPAQIWIWICILMLPVQMNGVLFGLVGGFNLIGHQLKQTCLFYGKIISAVNSCNHHWTKQKILFHCDNEEVVTIWHKISICDP